MKVQNSSGKYGVFLLNCLYLGHTGVTSFCMHFKKKDVGYCGRLDGERESGL